MLGQKKKKNSLYIQWPMPELTHKKLCEMRKTSNSILIKMFFNASNHVLQTSASTINEVTK